MKRSRIFILGAGFSQPAGLPLGPDLWRHIRTAAEGCSSGFSEDLHLYLTYLRECRGKPLDPDDVDFEDFLAFLDIEHRLGFSGSDAVGIIGYSIPEHDEYAQQALFRLLRNYQGSWWQEDILPGRRKEKVILVDRQMDQAGQDLLRRRYGFLEGSKTYYVWSGFDESTVRLIKRGVEAT